MELTAAVTLTTGLVAVPEYGIQTSILWNSEIGY
jgi:hypothetical protein